MRYRIIRVGEVYYPQANKSNIPGLGYWDYIDKDADITWSDNYLDRAECWSLINAEKVVKRYKHAVELKKAHRKNMKVVAFIK